MSQKISICSPSGRNMIVDPSPDAFLRLKLNIRKGDKLLPLHEGGRIGPLVTVLGIELESETFGKEVVWCESAGKKYPGELVFFYPNQFPELFAKDTL